MALSRVQYEQEIAGNRNFIVTMPYISRDHIKVSVTGSDVPFSWLNTNTVQLAVAPNVGDIIDVRRETERKNLLVDFQDASTITEQQLDLATRQAFFLAQEAFDLTSSTLAVANDGSYSASGRRLSLLGDPDSDDDATTQGWVKAQYISGKDAHEERVSAEDARDQADQHRQASASSASQAAGYRDTAGQHKDAAAGSASTASGSAATAGSHKDDARAYRDEAEGFKNQAKTSEDNAESWANSVNMPNSSGNGLKLLRQKSDETGLEYFDDEFVDEAPSDDESYLRKNKQWEQSPIIDYAVVNLGAIYKNNRYTVANPFGNAPVFMVLEVYNNGEHGGSVGWGTLPNFWQTWGASNDRYGTTCTQFNRTTLVVYTAPRGCSHTSHNSGDPFNFPEGAINRFTNSRIHVWRLKI